MSSCELVYVAGPYRAKTVFGVALNIFRAWRVTRCLMRDGINAVCPHTMYGFMSGPDIAEQRFLESGLELLSRCDAIVLLPGWERSSGTIAEIKAALAAGKRVFARRDDKAWARLAAEASMRQLDRTTDAEEDECGTPI